MMAPHDTDTFTRRLGVALLSFVLAGCATNGEFREDFDPLEGFNRVVTRFNDEADRWVLKPLAKGYQAAAPDALDRGVTNFFSNLDDVLIALNNLLQFKPKQAGSDVGRVLVNTTVGILGLMDVATPMGMEKHNEDFGQTLGAWGVPPGPYLVLPIFGPSTLRDAVGLAGTITLSPEGQFEGEGVRNSLRALKIIDRRADNLSASRVLEQAALDRYSFVRDAYLQRRRFLVYDGSPPPQPYFMDELDESGEFYEIDDSEEPVAP